MDIVERKLTPIETLKLGVRLFWLSGVSVGQFAATDIPMFTSLDLDQVSQSVVISTFRFTDTLPLVARYKGLEVLLPNEKICFSLQELSDMAIRSCLHAYESDTDCLRRKVSREQESNHSNPIIAL